jgi:hypothetical protein
MWTDTDEGRQFLIGWTKSIIEQVNDDESEFVDELIDEYFMDPDPPKHKEAAVGFGLGALAIPLTPAVMAILTGVLAHLLKEFSSALISNRINRYLEKHDERQEKEEQAHVDFTPQHLARIREIANQIAGKYFIPQAYVAQIVDEIVLALALPNP